MKSNVVYDNAGWLCLRQVLMKKWMLMTKTKKKKNVEKEESNLDERNVRFFFLEPETIETFIWTKPSIQSKARPNHLALGGHQRNMLWCPKWKPIYIYHASESQLLQVSPNSHTSYQIQLCPSQCLSLDIPQAILLHFYLRMKLDRASDL